MHQSNSILESVGEGIYGFDREGRVTVINPAAAQMLGYRPEELLGRNIHNMTHHTRADGSPYPWHDCSIRRAMELGDTVRVSDELFWRKDGTCFPVEYVARPQFGGHSADSSASGQLEIQGSSQPHGQPIGAVVAFMDITARTALDRMKDEFISTVSHELRTPLTSLRAALGLVTGGVLESRPERTRQMLGIAIGNTDRLIRLVNDILDIERLASGSTELHSEQLSAETLFRTAVASQESAATKAGIRFTFCAENVLVWADRHRILQALGNLLSNAVKFSPTGAEIILEAHYINEHEAQINIRDQGRGIPKDRLESIFERFGQVDASDTRASGGTGLGLAICRSIVQQHGGHIWATSSPGQGAALHFTLPTHAR